MGRMAWFVFFLTASSVVADEPGKTVKILAQGDWPHLPTHGTAGIGTDREHRKLVIRTEDELTRAAGSGGLITIPQSLGVTAIDFKKSMLLALEDGTQPLVGVSGGGAPSALYAVTIVRVERDETAKT